MEIDQIFNIDYQLILIDKLSIIYRYISQIKYFFKPTCCCLLYLVRYAVLPGYLSMGTIVYYGPCTSVSFRKWEFSSSDTTAFVKKKLKIWIEMLKIWYIRYHVGWHMMRKVWKIISYCFFISISGIRTANDRS